MLKFIRLIGVKGEEIDVFIDKIVAVREDPDDRRYSYVSMVNGEVFYVDLLRVNILKLISEA